jgi:hypothetical protein
MDTITIVTELGTITEMLLKSSFESLKQAAM